MYKAVDINAHGKCAYLKPGEISIHEDNTLKALIENIACKTTLTKKQVKNRLLICINAMYAGYTPDAEAEE